MKLLNLLAASIALGAFCGMPATAHHSSTYFDMDVDLVHENATVVDFKIANPHGILVYTVVNDEGVEEEWNAELPSANFSRRGGVVESILSPGDSVTVIGWPGLPGRTREKTGYFNVFCCVVFDFFAVSSLCSLIIEYLQQQHSSYVIEDR